MTGEPDELRRLVEELPDDKVALAIEDVRRRVRTRAAGRWPLYGSGWPPDVSVTRAPPPTIYSPRGSAGRTDRHRWSASRLGMKGERLRVTGSDDREVPAVESGDIGLAESLGQSDQGGVGRPQPKVGVGLDQVRSTQ